MSKSFNSWNKNYTLLQETQLFFQKPLKIVRNPKGLGNNF